MLGTCFGLLTTDNPAAIATLLTRLRRLDLGGVAHVEELCGRLLWEPSAMPMQRYAAAAALSSIARQRPLGGCGQACEALTPALADRDGALAAEARTGLWRHDRSGAALAALLDDLRHGSEHARVAAARALATPLRSTQTAGDTLPPAAVAALTDCLDDASPALRSAAAHALATGAPIAAAAALTRARARRPWELGYALDRDGPGQEP